MEKRSTKNEKSIKRIFNKLGMTYVELICALALLSLIIVMFTPMLLSSYESLYAAGEKVVDVYESKEEMEKGLARRDSSINVNFNMNLKVNATTLFENINVKGRKIVSSAQKSFETIFGQVRPTLTLLSPSHVNDDTTSYDILIQTKGLEFEGIMGGSKFPYTIDPNTGKSELPADKIFVEVVIPDKTKGGGGNNDSGNSGATEEQAVYSGTAGYCALELKDTKGDEIDPIDGVYGLTNRSDEGRIAFTISNNKLDFTYSPLKINVYYVNPRGKTRVVSEYIYIDPPTLMFAGETSEADYYTSAGVKEISEDSTNGSGETVKTSKYTLETLARTMRTSNSVYLTEQSNVESSITVGSPSQLDVEIKNIRWIANDETAGLEPYYVMTGTGGTIYRMYNYTSDATDIYEYSTGHTSKNTTTAYYGSTTHDYIDQAYDISTGHRIYPSLWSGDFSHIFEYTSAKKRVAYGSSANYSNDETWLTSQSRKGLVGDDNKYNVMSLRAQYAYYYNGDGTGHKFGFKDGRTISYVLTERGWPIRLYGVIGPADPDEDYFEDFAAVWDKNNTTVNIRSDTIYRNASEVLAFHYKNQNSTQQADYVYAPIRIKSLASYPLTANTNSLVNYMDTEDDYENSTSMAKISTVRRGQGESDTTDRLNSAASDVNITDAIYIPSTTTTTGTTFYVGTVHGYANIIQTDKIEAGAAEHNEYTNALGIKKDTDISDNGMVGRWYQNRSTFYNGNACSYPKGTITDYLVLSNKDGTATYVAKFNDGDYSRMSAGDRQSQLLFCTDYISQNDANITSANAATMGLYNGSDRASNTEFFLPNQSQAWTYLYLGDVSFTFGYASNRERVYTNITYDGTIEYTRSFERLYWRSHYGQDAVYTKEDGELSFSNYNSNQSIYSGTALGIHQANRAVSDSSGNLQNSQPYLNSIDNDYYNVWFPGEMYNLTNVASKDGVTVATGYAVAGSTYQYAHASDYSVTSTALGSIYNDGVLSAMVEGQDSAFVNLLYYKDNESFDSDSLWMEKDKNGNVVKKGYSQYSNYTSTNYGTHSRDSIQFTAVDLFVEEKDTSVDNKKELKYWAVYGDSKGRAYMSLVATGTATGTGKGDPDDPDSTYEVDRDIQLVSYISDQITSSGVALTDDSVVSNMQEIVTIDGYTLDVAFSKITSIEASDNLVVITGVKQTGLKEIIVVGQCTDGVWTWKWHQNGEFGGDITDATIANGYYYFVGYEGAGKSFLGAISVDTLKEWPNAIKLNDAQTEGYSYNKDEVIWVYTTRGAKINTIAGRAT